VNPNVETRERDFSRTVPQERRRRTGFKRLCEN
jgi:hypothetical protein